MKLTAKQLECLRELAKPGNRAIYMRYMGSFNPNAYWFTSGNMKRCTRQVESLINLGLVEYEKGGKPPEIETPNVIINAKGRELLRECK